MKNQSKIVCATKVFSATPTISTSGYSAGDALGGLTTFSDAVPATGNGAAFLEGIRLTDKQSGKSQVDVVIFEENPDSTTVTDNTALDIADGDLSKILFTKSITSTDYVEFNDNSVAILSNIGFPLRGSSISGTAERDIYVALVERGTPSRAVGDISVSLIVSWLGE
jgi:hypothetical protein